MAKAQKNVHAASHGALGIIGGLSSAERGVVRFKRVVERGQIFRRQHTVPIAEGIDQRGVEVRAAR